MGYGAPTMRLTSILGLFLSPVLVLAACGAGNKAGTTTGGGDTSSGTDTGSGTSAGGSGGAGTGGMAAGSGGDMSTGGSSAGGAAAGGMGGGSPMVSEGAVAFGTYADAKVYQSESIDFPGAKKTVLMPMGLSGGFDLRTLAFSPDGTRLAISGSDTSKTMPVLNVYAGDGSGMPVTLATAPTVNQKITGVAFSPDGVWVAFTGEIDLNNQTSLYVTKADGSIKTPKRINPTPTDTKLNVSNFRWARSANATHAYLAYSGDVVTDGAYGLWIYDAVGGGAPVEVIAQNKLMKGQAVAPEVLDWDKSGKVYFKSNHEVAATFRAYRANADGTMLEQVPATKLTNAAGEASIGNFAVSPDGASIAFAADAPSQHLYQVYAGAIGMTATVVSNVQSSMTAVDRGPSFFSPMVWSPDQKWIAVVADWAVKGSDADNAFNAFVLPADKAGGTRLFPAPPAATQDIDEVRFTSNSKRVFASGDLAIDNGGELYTTADFTTADQPLNMVTAQNVADANHDVTGFVIRP